MKYRFVKGIGEKKERMKGGRIIKKKMKNNEKKKKMVERRMKWLKYGKRFI